MIKEDPSLGWRISSKLYHLPTGKHGKTWKFTFHMIRMIIVDEMVERNRIGMRVFSFGKLVCEYFPKYLWLAQELAVKEASVILGRRVKYSILFPLEKTGKLPSVGGKIKCSDTELQHVCMADSFMSLEHRAWLDGAITFVCKDLLSGKRVNFLPGQQKKQHITQSIKQMRMVSISSSLKHLVPMTKLLRRRSGGEMEKGLWWSSIRWRPSMNYTSKSALPKHASIKKARMEKC
jgi:hypothetical protein